MRSPFALLVLTGCAEPPTSDKDSRGSFTEADSDTDSDTDTDTDADADTDTDTDSDTDSDTDTDTDVPVFDCALVPDGVVEETELDAPRGEHGIVFDDDGNLLGSDGNNIMASQDTVSSEIWVPNVGRIDNMDLLPDGDVVAANSEANEIVRVDGDEGRTTIASLNNPYGVVVAPDGRVFTGSDNDIYVIDPDAWDSDVFASLPGQLDAQVFSFSPNYDRLYIGTRSNDGDVYAIDLDEKLDPIDDPYLFATKVGAGSHDAMGVDVCGNLYVADYWTASIWRVSPLGEVAFFHNWGKKGTGYTHGFDWGSGIGPWRTDAIYGAQPYDGDTVVEMVVGIPSREYNGGVYDVINAER